MNTKMFEDMMREGMTFEEIIKAAEAADAKIAEEKEKELAEEKAKWLNDCREKLAEALVDYMEALLGESFSVEMWDKYYEYTIDELNDTEAAFKLSDKLIHSLENTFSNVNDKSDKSLMKALDYLDKFFS